MTAISKAFGAVQALREVNLSIFPGTIHAVVGENGAGKSTLMRCLYGSISPDGGQIEVEGSHVPIPHHGKDYGIGMVSQHYGIIPGLSTLENLCLGAETGRRLNPIRAQIQATALADQLKFEFDWQQDAEELSPSQAQKLEILKLLWREARIMILDEPTAMLSPIDADLLYRSLRMLVGQGATAIVVTHRIREVMEYCDRVTVLRAGKVMAEVDVKDTDPQGLARLMVGTSPAARPARATPTGEPALVAKKLNIKGNRGELAVVDATLELRAGEMVGIAGVEGNGQRELIEALYGLRRIESGELTWQGKPLVTSTQERIRAGFRLIPEDRHAEAVIDNWSLEMNGALGLQRQPYLSRAALVDPGSRSQVSAAIAARFGTKFGKLNDPIKSLSGGNQQRFVAGRALYGDEVRLILAIQAARGLDIAATAAVYDGLNEQCAAGACALVVSYDLDELLDHCGRILVMFGGRLFAPPADQALDRDTIGRLMVGVTP